MKILALDFDGVIADSLVDCFVTGYNTYLKFNPDSKLLKGVCLTLDNYEEIIDYNKELFSKFKKIASYATGGKYFVLIFYILENNEEINSQLEFDVYCSNLFDAQLDGFQSEFYIERDRLQKIDMDKWYGMTSIFKEVLPNFNALIGRVDVFIVTNRDKKSVLQLSEKFGLKTDPDKIIGKEHGLNKSKKLASLALKFNVSKSDVVLVDDLIKHVLNVKHEGFSAYLVSWGYSTPEQQAEAEKLGIHLLNKENFYRVVTLELSK